VLSAIAVRCGHTRLVHPHRAIRAHSPTAPCIPAHYHPLRPRLQSTGTIAIRNFATPLLPPRFPDPTSPNQMARRHDWVRYIRISSTALLHFREIVVSEG
jgi:hypothetical protein